jgi:hypothetical protein
MTLGGDQSAIPPTPPPPFNVSVAPFTSCHCHTAVTLLTVKMTPSSSVDVTFPTPPSNVSVTFLPSVVTVNYPLTSSTVCVTPL